MEIADMLTKLIQNFLNKNIGELEDKNISITLPNGKRIELGNHQSSIEITFNSWLGIWIIFRRGALGLTEGYINNCLLYTSPSPRDKRQSRMPSSA